MPSRAPNTDPARSAHTADAKALTLTVSRIIASRSPTRTRTVADPNRHIGLRNSKNPEQDTSPPSARTSPPPSRRDLATPIRQDLATPIRRDLAAPNRQRFATLLDDLVVRG
jgi:hypothetical protein